MIFSERLGYRKVEETILINSLSNALRNRLSNIIENIFATIEQKSYNTSVSPYKVYSYFIINYFKERRKDNLPSHYSTNSLYADFLSKLDALEWYAYYDVLEIFASMGEINKSLRDSLNLVLEEEKSGFRLLENNMFVPVTDEI